MNADPHFAVWPFYIEEKIQSDVMQRYSNLANQFFYFANSDELNKHLQKQ